MSPRPIIHFVAGLPRSGSTLLLNLLGQHPNHHVTPTNGLLGLVAGVQQSWTTIEPFVAQGLKKVEPRIAATLRAMFYGFYERELGSGQVVFDKNRGWTSQIELLEVVFNRQVPIICPIRDVKAIIASFEKLHRSAPIARRHYLGPNYLQAQTIQGRAEVLLAPAGVVGRSVAQLRDALNRGTADRLVLVPYRSLTMHPMETLQQLHVRLGLPHEEGVYDPNRIEQITQEDDALYGWGHQLHAVKSKVEPASGVPWEGVLPPHVCQWIDHQVPDINQLTMSVAGSAEGGAGCRPIDPRE